MFRAGPVPPPAALAALSPDGPIEHEPPLIALGDRGPALHRALAGVTLGAFDERIVTWLASWDSPTVVTLASLIHRARATERTPARAAARSA